MSQKPMLLNSEQHEHELCKKLEAIRLMRNLSQTKLAQAAGVSRRTISRMENGQGVSLDTFIRVMMALDMSDNLAALIPPAEIRPLERVHQKKERKNASSPRTPKKSNKWEWGN